jgi:hypothetical protein
MEALETNAIAGVRLIVSVLPAMRAGIRSIAVGGASPACSPGASEVL